MSQSTPLSDSEHADPLVDALHQVRPHGVRDGWATLRFHDLVINLVGVLRHTVHFS